MRRLRGVLVVFGLVGCVGPEAPVVVTGEWGGAHLGLIVTDVGATLEYDCAEGRIDGDIRPARSGRFFAIGLHIPGHGGPIDFGEIAETRPARYDGTVRGDKMTLTVTLTDTGEVLGTYTLVQGASPHVIKCL